MTAQLDAADPDVSVDRGSGIPWTVSLSLQIATRRFRDSRRQPPSRAARRPVTATPPAPRFEAPLDRRYWVEHCEGFRVDGVRGRIGVVEEVRGEGGDCLLAIRTGVLGLKVMLISASEVFEIVPRARKLWLRTPDVASRPAEEPSAAPLEPARGRVAA